MPPADLIAIARELVNRDHPRQAYLNRAMSTAYYAMFHALCRNCADTLVGPEGTPDRSSHAWNQAYRAVEHGYAKNQCKRKPVMDRFPETIRNFAVYFVTLQELRHEADYDPAISFQPDEVLNAIVDAEVMIDKLNNSTKRDRQAFSVWIAMNRRHKNEEFESNKPDWLSDKQDRQTFT
ncbi:MAG: hypothetical protein OXD45_03260 [Rhodobacteraceae bacterium]|nr:hypothetical protein [Paracoccaceae bacterium]